MQQIKTALRSTQWSDAADNCWTTFSRFVDLLAQANLHNGNHMGPEWETDASKKAQGSYPDLTSWTFHMNLLSSSICPWPQESEGPVKAASHSMPRGRFIVDTSQHTYGIFTKTPKGVCADYITQRLPPIWGIVWEFLQPREEATLMLQRESKPRSPER